MRVSASQTGTGQGRDDGREGAVGGSSVLPQLDARELAGLRAVGAHWQGSVQDLAAWERALPVDPRLSYEGEFGARRGRFVEIRIGRPDHSDNAPPQCEAHRFTPCTIYMEC